jgi:hypothetical protein
MNRPLRVNGKAELEKTGDIYRRGTATNRGTARSPPNSCIALRNEQSDATRDALASKRLPRNAINQPATSCSFLGISRVPIPVQMQIQRDVTSSRCGYIIPDVSNDDSSTPQHSPYLRFLVVFLNPTVTMSTTLHQLTEIC